MYTLYGTQGSGSAAIEAALVLTGAPYALVRASSWEADSAQAELRAANALAQVPTLRLPDGSVLTESAAILIHLGLIHPEAGLLPQDPAARAQVVRGLVFIAANCYAAISVIDFPERWLEPADEAGAERLRAGTRRRLHLHWKAFADTFMPCIPAAGRPGALALLAAVVSRWSGARAHLATQRPELLARLQAVDVQAPVDAVFARHWPGA